MKVVVIGGYGVFGSRIAKLLIDDGHDVVVAGRNRAKAVACSARIGGAPALVDARANLDTLFRLEPDAVVDAAGPYQTYEKNPYYLPKACIEHGVHYFDLADDAEFATGIGSLDAAAQQAGVVVLSGASSVPTLSAAAVEALRLGMTEIDSIETTILPGNRAPRGRSVVSAVVGQVGRPMRVWKGGAWRAAIGWSDGVSIDLAAGRRRRAVLIGAPDLTLFPQFFKARTVLFRAGLELGVMQYSLEVLSRLRASGVIRSLMALVPLLHWAAHLLRPFGTDSGGMTVDIVGRIKSSRERRHWTLRAGAGDGPIIPAVPIWVLFRHFETLDRGARACLTDLSIDAYVDAMSRFDISAATTTSVLQPLFETALGDTWRALPAEVARLHAVYTFERYVGKATVRSGGNPLTRLIAMLFRFPVPGEDIPVAVEIERRGKEEVWLRDFASKKFKSRLSLQPSGRVREQFGPFAFDLEFPLQDGKLQFDVCRANIFGLPLPKFLSPRCDAFEFVEDGRFMFDVALFAPLGLGLLVHYKGWLVPEEETEPASTP